MKKENKYKGCSKTRVVLWLPHPTDFRPGLPTIDDCIPGEKHFKHEECIAAVDEAAKHSTLVKTFSDGQWNVAEVEALAREHKFDALTVLNARQIDVAIFFCIIVCLKDYNIWVQDLMTGFDSRKAESVDVLVHALAYSLIFRNPNREFVQKCLPKDDEALSELVKKKEDDIKREYFSDVYGIKAE